MKLGLAFGTLWSLPAVLITASTTCDESAQQSFDGKCNNLLNPSYGAAFTAYRRGPEGVEYEDGVMQPATTGRPQPRDVSNRIGAEDATTAEDDVIPHSMMAVMFGQFINHDFENNDKLKLFVSRDEDVTVFAQDLLVPDPNDFFCFFNGGPNRCDPDEGPYHIPYRPSAGSTATGQFEVVNRGTSYLDLGTIYGNNEANATALRSFEDGKLLTDDYSGTLSLGPTPFSWTFSDLPPSRATTGLNTDTANRRFALNEVLTHGDFRLNNNVALAGFHTLFLREHNYIANKYHNDNPDADDEEIFQQARRRNIAQFQKIVVEDYLLAEFGSYFTNLVGAYDGYDDTVDASTGAAFAGAAFRYGHSTLRGYAPLNECGIVSTIGLPSSELPSIGQTGGPINILGLLFLSGNTGFETVMRGLVATRTRPVDAKFDDGVRNIIIPGGIRTSVGVDLLSLDMQRGRTNGVPNYDRLREAYHPDGSMYGSPGCGKGLAKQTRDDPLVCFIRLVSGGSPGQPTAEETDLATELQALYGKINRIDGIVGMLVEPHVAGSSFGETVGRIVADQYKRARDGDRFWYENVYGTQEQAEVKAVTMKTLLERNFDLTDLPENVFFAPADFAGDLASLCSEGSVR